MEVEMKIRGLMMDPMTNMPVVILKEACGSGILPIWVGVHEANAIALEIERVVTRGLIVISEAVAALDEPAPWPICCRVGRCS